MTFPVAQSFQIEKFAQIHPTVFEQDHIFHLRPWRSCFPRGAGTNQAWILGWGFAELLCHPFPGRKAFLGRKQQDGGSSKAKISLWAAFRPWRSFQVHPRGCSETAQGHKPHTSLAQGSTFPFPPVLIPNPTNPQAGGKPDSLPIMAINHPHTWLWSVEKKKKGIALIFQQFRARYPCWHKELLIFHRAPSLLTQSLCFQLLPAANQSSCRRFGASWLLHPTPRGFAGVFCLFFLALGPGRHHPEGSSNTH